MAVENLHKNLPDASLHNPKGFASASNNTKITKDSTGGLNYQFDLTIKTIDLGDWDMDATASLNVAHGLSATEWKTIRSASLIIRNDADTTYYEAFNHTISKEVYFTSMDSTNIVLNRAAGGTFDDVTFDSTSYNRGWLTIQYTID